MCYFLRVPGNQARVEQEEKKLSRKMWAFCEKQKKKEVCSTMGDDRSQPPHSLESCAIPSETYQTSGAEKKKKKLVIFSLSPIYVISKSAFNCVQHSGRECWLTAERGDASRPNMRCNFRFQLNHDRNLFGVKLCQLLFSLDIRLINWTELIDRDDRFVHMSRVVDK